MILQGGQVRGSDGLKYEAPEQALEVEGAHDRPNGTSCLNYEAAEQALEDLYVWLSHRLFYLSQVQSP